MAKKIAFGGLVALLVLGGVGVFVSHVNAQTVAGVCGTTAPDVCTPGTATNASVQFATAGDYYTWDCIGPNNGPITTGCTYNPATQGPAGPVTNTGTGASCTANSQCATGFACLGTGQCTAVACGQTDPCGTGDTCQNGDSAQAVCVPSQSTVGACEMTDNCNVFQGQVCHNPGTPSSYCGLPTGGSGSSVGGLFSSIPGASAGCTGDFTHNLAAAQACNALFQQEATALGYTASCNLSTITGADPTTAETICAGEGLPNNPACLASLATGYEAACTVSGNGSLGALNGSYIPYAVIGYSGEVNGSSVNTWYQLGSGASTGSGSTGGTGTTGTGSTGAGTTGGTGTTGNGNGATPGAGSTVPNSGNSNPALTSALNGFSSVLNDVLSQVGLNGLTLPGVAGGGGATTGVGTGATGGTTGTTGAGTGATGTTGGTCANSAEATITSSVATLQGLATVLTAGNVSAGVLASVQNLINAIAGVLNALSGCIGSGGGATGTTGTTGGGGTGTTGTTSGVAFTINGVTSGLNLAVGQAWTLSITSNLLNAPVTLCAIDNNGVQSCTPGYGSTDGNGAWTLSKAAAPGTVGNWQEWAEVGTALTQSNHISFTVSAATTNTGAPTFTINGLTSGVTLTVGQTWSLGVTSNLPNTAVTLCAIDNNGVQSCTPGFGSTGANGAWTLTNATAPTTVGTWQEWAELGTGSVESNNITFNVTATGTATNSGPCNMNSNCNVFQGQVCKNAGTPQSYCTLPNSTTPNATIASIFVSAGVPASEQGICPGLPAGNIADMNTCNAIFTAQAIALGYNAPTCNYTVQTLPGAQTTYDAACTLSGNGLLGSINGSFIPWAVVGYSGGTTGSGASTWYQL